jgi:hypothetical protein
VGQQTVRAPAFYARPGSLPGDLVSLLHPPYTAWHLSYAAIGAALAPSVDWLILAGTLLAFFFGTGIGAHALDELHGRPLRTRLSDRVLAIMGGAGLAGGMVLAALGAVMVSPWLLVWGTLGAGLAAGYALERPRLLHTDLGFGMAWGGFPVLVGYWAQTSQIDAGSLAVAGAATLFSLAQRVLSTPARHLRRSVDEAEVVLRTAGTTVTWTDDRLLDSWELPLRLTGWAMVLLAVGLLSVRA